MYANVLPHLSTRAGSAADGAHVLGAHTEGPFITVQGCHPTENLCVDMNETSFDRVYGRDNWTCAQRIRIVTMAPELDG